MINLPLALRIEKNKVAATAPWLLLLSVTLPDTSVVRLVSNNESIIFGGNTYQPFPFDLDVERTGSDKSVSELSLKVSNVTRALQPYLEQYSGLVGSGVRITVVHADNLTEDYASLTLDYEILATSCDEEWVSFTLGQPNLIRKRFPLYTAQPKMCVWKFKSASCGYTGGVTTCDNTLESCREKNNSPRFGGRPGLQSPGAKFL